MAKNNTNTATITGFLINPGQINIYTNKIIELINGGININYHGTKDYLEEKNILSQTGVKKYVISPCNEDNKYSEGYYCCLGVVVIGKEKNSTKQLSILTHLLDKGKELVDNRRGFYQDFTRRLDTLMCKVEKNSIEVSIFGGSTRGGETKCYDESREAIEYIIKHRLNISPTILVGPNTTNSPMETSAYIETQTRNIYITRRNLW